jgi:hypothetical protein
MHVIPDDLLDMVAGGATAYSTETDSVPSVTVPGYLSRPPSWNPGYFPSFPSDYDHGSRPADGFEPVHLIPFEFVGDNPCDRHTSPEPDVKPANISMEMLRDVVLDTVTVLADYDQTKEHAILILVDGSGNISTTQFFSQGLDNKVTIAVDIPADHKVVAWLHNHPHQPGLPGNIPSTPDTAWDPEASDTEMVARFMSHPQADPGLQLYIYDSEKGKTWEYPGKGPIERRPLGNNITDDVVRVPC